MTQMDDQQKKNARAFHMNTQMGKRIKAHIDRGPRICCLDKHKDDMPSYFVRCPDCIKPLDSTEEIC